MSNLKLTSICKSYGTADVLRDISLEVEDGEFVVFVGPSGCGKSTLLKLICGLEDVTSGALEIGDRDVTGLAPFDRGIAMVFQSYALYPHLTVYNNIAFPLRLQKLPKTEIDAIVRKAAATLDLTERLSFKPAQLSGGQRQRVAIGRAIVRNPKIFLFDEPLSNLDAELRGQMRVELTELHQKLATTMVYVTHDQVEAMTMADRIVVLKDGRIEQFGKPMELYHRPKTRFVAGFIGQPGMNFIPAQVRSVSDKTASIETAGGFRADIPFARDAPKVGGKVELGIRPEFLSMTSAQNGLDVKVRLVERLGGTSLLYGSLSGGTRVVASFEGQTELPATGNICLGFDPAEAHLFGADGLAL